MMPSKEIKTYEIKDFNDVVKKLDEEQIERFVLELKEIFLLQKAELRNLGKLSDAVTFGAINWRDDGRQSVDSINYIADGEIFASKHFKTK